eukprot:367893-Pleurochrysis_carterae.AAC.3
MEIDDITPAVQDGAAQLVASITNGSAPGCACCCCCRRLFFHHGTQPPGRAGPEVTYKQQT